MKKHFILLIAFLVILSLVSCSNVSNRKTLIQGNYNTYYQLNDGTWECNGNLYKYKLEIDGTMPNAAKESRFVYLSNVDNISFDQAWKAAGLSSDTNDFFPVEEAVLVEMY